MKTPPLEGIRVLDLSRILAGPVCCQVLADLGADVVKVERPITGDDTRRWGPPFLGDCDDDDGDGPSAYYLSANRGKRGLALDLSSAAGREVLDDLIRQADVLVENFLPQSRDKLGLEPARLQSLNPELVVASISGFGRTGPKAEVPGYDLVIQALCGLMSITGEPQGEPMKVGVAISDVLTGLFAAISTLAGLHSRGQGRGPASFDLALADCTLASLVNVAQAALISGTRPQRYGNAHPHIVPYQSFATADGHLVLAVGNDRQWQRFCTAVGHHDWASDERFESNPQRVGNRDALVAMLRGLFAERTTDAWQRILTPADVPHAAVKTLDQALEDEQTRSRQMVVETTDWKGRRFPILGSPIHWQGETSRAVRTPPEIGQQTDEVLGEWVGYGTEQIDELRRCGVIT